MKRAAYALSIFLVLFFAVTINAQDQETDNSGTKETDQTETQQTETQKMQHSNMNMQHTQQAASPTDFSSLDAEVSDQKQSELKAIAEEHANKLRSELSLNDDQTEEVREAITEYLTNYWESRVLVDKDPQERSEHSADLAYDRVELSEEIKDILDDKAKQWDSGKVEWWTSLDMASFSNLQESAATAVARGDQNTDNDDDKVQ